MTLNLAIVSAAQSSNEVLERLRVQPAFRKATRNMLLAASALEKILAEVPDLDRSRTALVLGSSLGELETTKDFLGHLATTGVARPLLFQSSLHNATLGFLALHYGFRGPSLSVSQRHFSGEACLETAQLLLEAGHCAQCLVLGVEGLVVALRESLEKNYPAGLTLTEGASALLLTKAPSKNQGGSVIRSVEYPGPRISETEKGPYYDSDSLARLLDAVGKSPTGELRLEKPDGSSSLISWGPA